MNVADAERISGAYANKGWGKTERIEQADEVVIVTCMIRQSAEDRILGLLRTIAKNKKKNLRQRIILTGCMVGMAVKEIGTVPLLKVIIPIPMATTKAHTPIAQKIIGAIDFLCILIFGYPIGEASFEEEKNSLTFDSSLPAEASGEGWVSLNFSSTGASSTFSGSTTGSSVTSTTCMTCGGGANS